MELAASQDRPTELRSALVLPSSVPVVRSRTKMGVDVRGNSIPYTLTYCANCSKEGVWVPEASVNGPGGFAFYLCSPCGDKWTDVVGLSLVPDEVFWERVKQEMLAREGRILTAEEVVEAMRAPDHYLQVMARDRV